MCLKFLGNLFGMGGSTPKAAPPPLPAPVAAPARMTDQGVIDARNDQMQRLRGSRGSTSTMLASAGTGQLTGAAVPQGNKLLGQ